MVRPLQAQADVGVADNPVVCIRLWWDSNSTIPGESLVRPFREAELLFTTLRADRTMRMPMKVFLKTERPRKRLCLAANINTPRPKSLTRPPLI